MEKYEYLIRLQCICRVNTSYGIKNVTLDFSEMTWDIGILTLWNFDIDESPRESFLKSRCYSFVKMLEYWFVRTCLLFFRNRYYFRDYKADSRRNMVPNMRIFKWAICKLEDVVDLKQLFLITTKCLSIKSMNLKPFIAVESTRNFA